MRDTTVDLLKGFAIFLMVMGHFLAQAVSHLDGGAPHNGWLVGQWIYSFHMPLFYFLSGYLSLQTPGNVCELVQKVFRKAQTLLLPGFSFMLLSYWLLGSWAMASFLKILFSVIVVFVIVRYIAEKYRISFLFEILVHILVFIIWFIGSHYLKGTWTYEHLLIHSAAFKYPYVVIGYLFAKQDWNSILQKKNFLLTLGLVIYVVSYYVSNYMIGGTLSTYIREYIVAPAAILVIFPIAKRISVDNAMGHIFCYMGQKSLAIYLLSSYFLLSMPGLADWWIEQNDVTSIVTQLVTSVGASAICIALCLGVEWVICQSKILNFICFGKSIRK